MTRRIPYPVAALLAPLCLLAAGAAQAAAAPATPTERLPLAFEANAGQADARVAYLARGAGYALLLGAEGARLELDDGAGHAASLATRLLGANADAALHGEAPLPGVSSYLHGNDPAQWITGVAQFGAVRYSAVYPGIDLVYYGSGRQLEYDFRVAPGAEPSAIAMHLDGARSLAIDEAGNLRVSTAAGELVQQRPVAWQLRDGERVPVAAAFRLDGEQVRFALGDWDRSQPLVIDPLLSFNVYLPALQKEFAHASATDAAGNVYIAGHAQPHNPIDTGFVRRFVNHDAFVTKLDPTGTKLLYSIYFGGSQDDEASAIKVAPDGSVWVGGTTRSNDFPVTRGAAQERKAGFRDGFVAHITPNGRRISYASFLGGVADETLAGLALSADGAVTVVGTTSSIDFPTTPGALRTTTDGADSKGYASRLRADGTLAWSTYLGGEDSDGAAAVAVDAAGRAYVTGYTYSFAFPVTPDAFQPLRSPLVVDGTRQISYADSFLAVLEADGASLSYGSYFGSASIESGSAIDVNAAGTEVLMAGITTSSDLPLLNPLQSALRGGRDGYVAKFTGTPGALGLAYASYLGGNGYFDDVTAVALDAAGNGYLLGNTNSTNFQTRNPYQRANSGVYDVFLAKLAPGGALVYSTYLGGYSSDYGNGLSVDANGAATVTGYTYSTTFTTTPSPVQGASFGLGDPFAVRFAADGQSLQFATLLGETNVFAGLKLGNGGGGNGTVVDLPIPLRGVIGCTLRALDGSLLANTNILFPNHVACGEEQPAP